MIEGQRVCGTESDRESASVTYGVIASVGRVADTSIVIVRRMESDREIETDT